ncbi:alpha-1,2-fucosyltransferase [Micrococcus sp. HG099]|uniref:alpha-1,2-fucosyltransferase n=1 Tax=Micrococcus sp. HG099 TaxID=2969755 RepID=UPI00215B56EE|nr:alpha-1,2-fucosyltransferase [Micrococcus sp. HG099]MCR8674302.1 alpha-1,2-fucosyltransferase [Micrococcus sp. HG099]
MLRHAKSSVLRLVRHGRPVAWVPDWMNLGNLLYMGKWAYDDRDAGRRVLLHPKHEKTVGLFPALREGLFITPEEVRFTDQRVMPWSGQQDAPRNEFTDPEPDAQFIEDLLLHGSPLTEDVPGIDDSIVVNVRRGDYYSVPEYNAEYGMNQREYVRAAVAASVADGGRPDRIIVISDGMTWCREHLSGVLDPIATTLYQDGDVAHDLRHLIHARRLVLPNSTFSYWGGYIGDVAHPGREVTAPWFFSRAQDGGMATQLRHHWRRIDDIPGGWGPTGP